jgi:hypothetical protein
MDALFFDVTDDSGFLALVDPDAYAGFVDESWELEQLFERFVAQMRSRRLLIWGTERENVWRVRVQLTPAVLSGFREVAGTIAATQGRLLLTSYESLTMAAQFEDTTLPEPHESEQVIQVEPGTYRCRIIQLHDHADTEEHDRIVEAADVHYVLELLPSAAGEDPWRRVPWATV